MLTSRLTPNLRAPRTLRSLALGFVLGLGLLNATASDADPAVKPELDRAHLTPELGATVFTNRLGMQFVHIPAGEFQMGNGLSPQEMAQYFPNYDPKRLRDLTDETPLHSVQITRDFLLGRHEVTVGQFRRFVQASGYKTEAEADGTGGYGYNPAYDPAQSEKGDAFEGRNPRYTWRNPGFAQTDEHPVLNITYADALALAQWLTQQEGVRYRLPTEAEWEYACRAGSAGLYPHGNDPQALPQHANVFDRSAAHHWPQWQSYATRGPDGHPFTSPVGQYAPNPWGLHDMVGNAWEWVSDWYDEHYYANAERQDPQGPASGHVRVRRGGSWHTWPLYARCSFRNWNSPQTRYTLLGMRLVREIAPP